MYESAEWIAVDDPLGRLGQYRLIGPTPTGRLITVAAEWIGDMRAYRPISAWDATAAERRAWLVEMLGEE